jgi:hypothetical protein
MMSRKNTKRTLRKFELSLESLQTRIAPGGLTLASNLVSGIVSTGTTGNVVGVVASPPPLLHATPFYGSTHGVNGGHA